MVKVRKEKSDDVEDILSTTATTLRHAVRGYLAMFLVAKYAWANQAASNLSADEQHIEFDACTGQTISDERQVAGRRPRCSQVEAISQLERYSR